MLFNGFSLQDNIMICLAAMALTGLFQTVLFFTAQRFAPIRPAYDIFLDIIFSPFVTRLNRRYRKKGDLMFRGGLALLLMLSLMIFYGYIERWVSASNINSIYIYIGLLSLFLTVSTPILWGLRIVRGDDNEIFRKLARAGYANLIHHDQHGLYRYAIKLMALSFITGLILPLLLFSVFGLKAVLMLSSCLTLINIAGRQDYGGAFSAIAKLISYPFLIIGNGLAAFLVKVAARFALMNRKGKIANSTNEKPLKKNKVWEGGVALTVLAIKLKVTLGGPYQDRYGHPVAAHWVGYTNDSSKIQSNHVRQAAYTIAIAHLLFLFLLCGAYVLDSRLFSA